MARIFRRPRSRGPRRRARCVVGRRRHGWRAFRRRAPWARHAYPAPRRIACLATAARP